MKKLLLKSLLLSLLISFANLPVANAATGFPDVKETNANYDAILYLQEHGVIQGYADGTFKPTQLVNRAEFLKIILEGSNITSDVDTPTSFPDIDDDAWYGKYVRKAYSEGWINGYPDGTFKPEQTINKVEALKIVGAVQNWTLTKSSTSSFTDTIAGGWYIPYVNYAKSHGYLEETGSILSPDQLMSRAKISEIIYRTLTVNIEPTAEDEGTTEEVATPADDLDFDAVSAGTISKSFFKNITLNEDLPNTFYKNEIYVIKGSVNQNGADQATVIFSDLNNADSTFYRAKTTNQEFEIPISFNTTGNFKVGIIPGETGTSDAKEISVLPEITDNSDTTTAAAEATNLNISFSNDKTNLSFKAAENTIKKISFTQTGKIRTYLSRQNISSIPLIYKDFSGFNEAQVSFSIETASMTGSSALTRTSPFSTPVSKTFTATTHQYTENLTDKVTADPPDKLSNVSQISFSGTNQTDITIEAYVIKPDGLIDTVNLTTQGSTTTYLGKEVLKSGGSFSFKYTPTKAGTYIVEINEKEGEAVINHPIYIGGAIPLLPDYFDLHKRELGDQNISLNSARTELLELINDARNDHGLADVELSTELNDLAQAHAQDMANNDYFAHVNGENQTPQDRRLEAGVTTEVGENLARDVNLDFAHLGLMRSAGHRENILDTKWTRVGLGIVEDDGYLIVVEEFSSDPITASDLIDFKTELFDSINELRSDNGLDILTNQVVLNQASQYINEEVINNDRELDNALFTEALNSASVNGSSEALIRIFNVWDEILSSILEEETLLNSSWANFGSNIQLDGMGNINATLILNR